MSVEEAQEDPLFDLYAPAFETKEPYGVLRETVKGLLDQGYDRKILIESLTQFGLMLRSQGKKAEEDEVLDVLDTLTGWCHPDAQL
jgi:hypothetical protein